MIRTKGEAGTGDVSQAVDHLRAIMGEIAMVQNKKKDELYNLAKQMGVSHDLLLYVNEHGKLPVANFSAGGVATPADAALMRRLGAEGVFVGSGIFKSNNPEKRAKAIVKAVAHYMDDSVIAEVSENIGEAMVGINPDEIETIMATR